MANPGDDVDLAAFEERLAALERVLTDGDHDFEALADGTADAATLADLRDRIDDLETQVAEVDAATQALRGYVGNVREVNRDVERRADAALAKVEALEDRLPADEPPGAAGGPTDESATGERATTTGPATASGTAAGAEHCEHCGAPRGTEADPVEREPAFDAAGASPRRTEGARQPAADGRGRDGRATDPDWHESVSGDVHDHDGGDGGDGGDGSLLSSLRGSL